MQIVLTENTALASKPFTADKFIKYNLQRIAETVSPKQKHVFTNVSPVRNTVQSVKDRLENLQDRVYEKVTVFLSSLLQLMIAYI